MAANPLDMPILISQLPNLQQMAHAGHAAAEAQQVLFGHLVAENQRQSDHKVQEVEKKEGTEAVGKDAGGNSSSSGFARQQHHRPPAQGEEQDPTQSSNASPWAGNIINVKI